MDQARRAENKLGLAEHLATASSRLGVSTFALALLLAGVEPEELATAVTLAARDGSWSVQRHGELEGGSRIGARYRHTTDAMAVRVVEAIQERLTISLRVAQDTSRAAGNQ